MDTITIRAPVDMTRASADKALLDAAQCGDLEQVKAALAAGADLDAYVTGGDMVALVAASHNPRYDVSSFLVERGANLLCMNDDNETVLHGYAGRGWTDLVEKALDAGCDVNALDWQFQSALSLAGKHLETVKLLIQRGASPFRITVSGQKHMDIGSVPLLETAVAAGLSVNSATRDGTTMLMLSFAADDVALIHALLSYGADINASNAHGGRPISYAASRGAAKSFALLLERGAETDYSTVDGLHFQEILQKSSAEVQAVYHAWRSRQELQKVIGASVANRP